MRTMAVLSYIEYILPGYVLVVFGDDYEKMFHQFVVSIGSRRLFNIMALDPAEIATGNVAEAELAIFAELCIPQGSRGLHAAYTVQWLLELVHGTST